ncbi:MAG: sigma-70 family RNA polymerase sigma factor [Akkermansiaceae bacterium]
MNFFRWLTSKQLMAPSGFSPDAGAADEEIPDHKLIEACQKGDARAFETLVTRHRGKVYAMVQNMIKNEADAWDLSQEVFLKVWKALPKFEARAKFSTWLYRITHNVVYDWLRKRKIDSAGELDDGILNEGDIAAGARTTPTPMARPDQALANAELGERINAALATLNAEHRETVLLREVQGFDYKEIAKVMECSLGTVMSRLYYARKKLQALLGDEKGKD